MHPTHETINVAYEYSSLSLSIYTYSIRWTELVSLEISCIYSVISAYILSSLYQEVFSEFPVSLTYSV